MSSDIIALIDEFKAGNTDELVLDKNLNNNARKDVHEYCKSIGLFSESIQKNNTKVMIINKNRAGLETNKVFVDWSNIPIPIVTHESFNYYMDTLDKYYNCKKTYDIFLKHIGTCNKNYFNTIICQVIDFLKAKPEYQKFLDMKYDVPKLEFNVSKQVYIPDNKDKYFVSFDIRSATFTLVKHLEPALFGTDSWSDFIKQFTDNEYLQQCKYFREVLFGKSSLYKKIMSLLPIIMNLLVPYINPETMLVVMYSHDEIVCCVDKDFDINNIKLALDAKYKNYFHVEKFKLVQLGNRPYFVKEHIDGTVEFKCCPKKYLMQCIKYYEHKKIEPFDLKFNHEGDIVTFDSPITFD